MTLTLFLDVVLLLMVGLNLALVFYLTRQIRLAFAIRKALFVLLFGALKLRASPAAMYVALKILAEGRAERGKSDG
jgi:hypothetical protein